LREGKFYPIGGALIQRVCLFEARRSFENLRHLLWNLSIFGQSEDSWYSGYSELSGSEYEFSRLWNWN